MISRLLQRRLRLFPVLVLSAALLLGVKADVFWQLGSIGAAYAAAGEKDDKAGDKAGDAGAEGGKTAAADEGGKAPPARKKRSGRASFSPSEIDVLQRLAKRRDELEERQRELDTRERLLAAAEKQLKDKIAELKKIEAQIAAMLKQQDEAEEQRLNSLVKVYEKMKPKQAARIFEELEMAVLLQVARRMKEANVAKILASMDPAKARDVTARIAAGDDGTEDDKPARKAKPAAGRNSELVPDGGPDLDRG